MERKELRQEPASSSQDGSRRVNKTRVVLIKCPKCLSYLQWGGCLANVNDKKYILMAHDAAATVGHGQRKRLWGRNYRMLVPELRAECPGRSASLPRHPQGLGGARGLRSSSGLGTVNFSPRWRSLAPPAQAVGCPGRV